MKTKINPRLQIPDAPPQHPLGSLVITPWGLGIVEGVAYRMRPTQYVLGHGRVQAIKTQIDWNYEVAHLDEYGDYQESSDWWEGELTKNPHIPA